MKIIDTFFIDIEYHDKNKNTEIVQSIVTCIESIAEYIEKMVDVGRLPT